jgi:hypothetical protein
VPDASVLRCSGSRDAVRVLQVAVTGIIFIGGILAVTTMTIWALWWLTLMAIRRVPMIGKRHRHPDWDRFQQR